MNKFIFDYYEFDKEALVASFHYGFTDGAQYTETISFSRQGDYSEELLDRVLFLVFMLVGISYYKTFPTREVEIRSGSIDQWQADFLNHVYQEGLSQFAFENNLRREDLAQFSATTDDNRCSRAYVATGILALQSGGKDSLLTAHSLAQKGVHFTSWYVSNAAQHPAFLDELGDELHISRRMIDIPSLKDAASRGALNGHVPVTYIVSSFALVDAILNGCNMILLSIAHEGEEPHDWIGDLPVNHQWSKTWGAEMLFAEYVHKYISADIQIGSPLRHMSELRVAELFIEHAWKTHGKLFSSCNRSNYMQGSDNTQLQWCGECPKCANSFLLFAPFLPAEELKAIFGGKDLFASSLLVETFQGLLGYAGVMKPFECVGQVDELQKAYHMAQERGGYSTLPFAVPESDFDYMHDYESQVWTRSLV
jgi:hypothetical protein